MAMASAWSSAVSAKNGSYSAVTTSQQAAFVVLEDALWVHFAVEASQEGGPTVRSSLPGIMLGMERVCGEASAEASLSLAGRLISGTGYRPGAPGGLVAHLKLVLSPSSTRGTVGARPRRRCPQLRGRLEH